MKNDKIRYENIRKIGTGQGHDYITGCLLEYAYFKDYCKVIVIDLSKQQALDVDPTGIEQINFAANLDRKHKYHKETEKSISLLKRQNKLFRLFTRNCKSFVNAIPLNDLIFISIK